MLAVGLAGCAAYLLGSVSFAVVVSRVMGLADPRTFGSKNPGATNVLRSGSKVAGLLTFLLDGLKGWLPVALVGWFGEPYGLGPGTQALVALAAFAGHLWPVFFGFKGGKGVATAIGIYFGVHWGLGVAAGLTWIILAAFFRYSSLASIVTAVFAPFYFLVGHHVVWIAHRRMVVALVVMAAVLLYRHRENMVRLVKGTESKLGSKAKS